MWAVYGDDLLHALHLSCVYKPSPLKQVCLGGSRVVNRTRDFWTGLRSDLDFEKLSNFSRVGR